MSGNISHPNFIPSIRPPLPNSANQLLLCAMRQGEGEQHPVVKQTPSGRWMCVICDMKGRMDLQLNLDFDAAVEHGKKAAERKIFFYLLFEN